MKHRCAALLLEGGALFLGTSVGVNGVATGEVCFCTGSTGYQEVLTDPSFMGQILVFAFPHVGNVGVNGVDMESTGVHLSGVVLREQMTRSANYRAEQTLEEFFVEQKTVAIADVDTRAIVAHLRVHGVCRAVIQTYAHDQALDHQTLKQLIGQTKPMQGLCFLDALNTPSFSTFSSNAERTLVLIDYGVKTHIVQLLEQHAFRVVVVPHHATYQEIMAQKPCGVVLSNGPGDPSTVFRQVGGVLSQLLTTKIPILGICLGHQLLGLALGCRTIKMVQGHRGLNHPVYCLKNKKVQITTQNHGFVLDASSLPEDVLVTEVSLFDGSIAGITARNRPIVSVQYHPEASPGTHDARVVFSKFFDYVGEYSVV